MDAAVSRMIRDVMRLRKAEEEGWLRRHIRTLRNARLGVLDKFGFMDHGCLLGAPESRNPGRRGTSDDWMAGRSAV